jgi:hypothetical protein
MRLRLAHELLGVVLPAPIRQRTLWVGGGRRLTTEIAYRTLWRERPGPFAQLRFALKTRQGLRAKLCSTHGGSVGAHAPAASRARPGTRAAHVRKRWGSLRMPRDLGLLLQILCPGHGVARAAACLVAAPGAAAADTHTSAPPASRSGRGVRSQGGPLHRRSVAAWYLDILAELLAPLPGAVSLPVPLGRGGAGCLGVKSTPTGNGLAGGWEGHAWLVYEGEPLLERHPGLAERYTVSYRFPAAADSLLNSPT